MHTKNTANRPSQTQYSNNKITPQKKKVLSLRENESYSFLFCIEEAHVNSCHENKLSCTSE